MDTSHMTIAVVAGAAATTHFFTRHLETLDEWGRDRCQQIGTYVDVDEQFQCALTAGHRGDCDPLPDWPDTEAS